MRSLLALLLACTVTGCAGYSDWLASRASKDYENPVLGPPPPRVRSQNHLADEQLDPDGEDTGVAVIHTSDPVKSVSFDPQTQPTEFEGVGEIAARVNGRPILVSDILERHGRMVQAAQQQLPPDQFVLFKRELIKRDLPGMIDQMILVESIREKLPKEQWAKIEEQLDTIFQQYIEQELMPQLKAKSIMELEAMLQEEGSSLATMRRAFQNQQIAGQLARERIKENTKISRRELLDYYREHLKDFTEPDQVRFQQIWITFASNGGESGARKLAKEVLQKLKAGADFGDLAIEYSEGAQATDAGQWDWVQPDSLSDEQLKKAVTTLPVGTNSGILPAKAAVQIIRVNDRRQKNTKPFETVQDDIRKAILEAKKVKITQELLDELRAKSTIETILDDEPGTPEIKSDSTDSSQTP